MEREARPAVFLDRDGTLLEHVHYMTEPSQVRLWPGVARALGKLRRAGFACVVVTNQSAIGRGMITEARLREIHDEMNRQLAEQGSSLDAIYYCPDAPTGARDQATESFHRKPNPGMLLQAAEELGLDLSTSWMVGDLITDVMAGLKAGCRSILVESGPTAVTESDRRELAAQYLCLPDVVAAAEEILKRHVA